MTDALKERILRELEEWFEEWYEESWSEPEAQSSSEIKEVKDIIERLRVMREEHEVSEKEWKHVKLLSNDLCDKPDDYPDYVERSRVRELRDKIKDYFLTLRNNDQLYKKSTHFKQNGVCECLMCQGARVYNSGAGKTLDLVEKEVDREFGVLLEGGKEDGKI